MTTVGTGDYTYDQVEDWAKLPTGESFAMVSAVATDSQDRVYAFQRKDPPIIIFDRQGNLLDRWGGGDAPCAPGDFYAPHDIWADRFGDVYIGEVTWSAGGKKGLIPRDCCCLQKFVRQS